MDPEFPFTVCASLFGQLSVYTYSLLYILFITLHLVFVKPCPEKDWRAAGIVFGASSLLFLALLLVKWILSWAHKKLGTGEIWQCKLNLLIGFGLDLISQTIVRFWLFSFQFDQYAVAPILLTQLIFSIMIIFTFHYGQSRIIEYLDYSKTIPHTIITSIIYFIIMVITLRSGFSYKNEHEQSLFWGVQVLYSISCATSTTDILTLLWGGVKVTSERKRQKMAEARNWKRVTKETNEPFLTDVTMYCFTFLTVLLAISGLFFMISEPWTLRIKTAAMVIIGSSLTVIGLLLVVKWRISKTFEKFKVDNLNQCRIKLVIGFGGCTLCSLISRILVYFVAKEVTALCISQFIPLLAACILYYQFVHGFRKTHNLNYANNITTISVMSIANFIGLLASLRLGRFSEDLMEREIIMVSQFVFGLPMLFSSIDLGVVLMGGVYTRAVKVEEGLELVKAEKVVEKVLVKLEPKLEMKFHCPTCNLEYSETKTPRILKECGHTVCEPCANNKLEQTSGQYLTCPTCQIITLVKSTAELMPKNYTVLDLIHENIDKN